METQKIKNSIISFFESETFKKDLGKNWYAEARFDINQIIINAPFTDQHISLKIAAICCSILSPANKWKNNLWDLHFLFKQFYLNENLDYKFTTYGANVTKAKNVLKAYQLGQSMDSILFEYLGKKTSLKTFNFAQSILNDKSDSLFTIDRHMLTIAGLDKVITYKQYFELKEIYFECFLLYRYKIDKDISFVNFQAVLWCNLVLTKHGITH